MKRRPPSTYEHNKGKYLLVYAMNACRGSRGIASLILNLGTRWMWVVKSCPGRFNLWKKSRYPFNKRVGATQTRSGRFGEEKNLFALSRYKLRTDQPVA
jgi:hypothetical protein